MSNRFHATRDDYGRPMKVLTGNGRTLGVVVTLPKVARRANPERAYLVNDWTNPDRDAAVSYHRTLAAAKAHLVAITQGKETA
ncbi:MAG: hypothetical protein ACOYOQ_00385 [Microthrixaceae bacterium]